MKHIKNSIKGSIFLLEHAGVPVALSTDFAEPIKNGSICVNTTNQDLYIFKGNAWVMIGSGFNVDDWIPRNGTPINKPVYGDIEFLEGVKLYSGQSGITFSDSQLIFEFSDNDLDTNENFSLLLNRNFVLQKNTALVSFDSASYDNNINRIKTTSAPGVDFSNTVNNNINSNLNYPTNFSNFSNNTLNGVLGNNADFINTHYSSFYITSNGTNSMSFINNSHTHVNLDISQSQSFVYNTMLQSHVRGRVIGDNSIFDTISNSYIEGTILNSNYSNNTFVNSYGHTADLQLINSNYIYNLGQITGDDYSIISTSSTSSSIDTATGLYNIGILSAVDLSRLHNTIFLGKNTNIKTDLIYDNMLVNNNGYYLNTNTRKNLLYNNENKNYITTKIYSILEDSVSNILFNNNGIYSTSSNYNLVINTDNIELYGSNSLVFTPKEFLSGFTGRIYGGNNVIFSLKPNKNYSIHSNVFTFGDINSTSGLHIQNGNIIMGNVDIDDTLTTNNQIFGAKRLQNINHSGQSNNIFLNVDDFDVPDSNTVYLPNKIYTINLGNFGLINLQNISANRDWEFPDKSGTVALLDDILDGGSNGNFLPIIGDGILSTTGNYKIVYFKPSKTIQENGDELVEAINLAKTFSPNGNPLSATNRAVVFVMPGYYKIQDGDNISPLSLGQYVDIIGIGHKSEIIIVANSTGSYDYTGDVNGVINIEDNNNYVLKNLTILNESDGLCLVHNEGVTDNGIWEDVDMKHGVINYNSIHTEGTIWAGTYRRCNFNAGHALYGSITGLVENCDFYYESCGFTNEKSDVVISGVIKGCTGQGDCFGISWGKAVTISGEISDCDDFGVGMGAFGYSGTNNVTISGLIDNCHIKDNTSWGFGVSGKDVLINGIIKNSSCLGINSFGCSKIVDVLISGDVTISGLIDNCFAGNNSFGYNSKFYTLVTIDINGIIKNCQGGNYCFASSEGNTTVSGKIINCTAGLNSFNSCGNNRLTTMTGLIENCQAGDDSFSGSIANSTHIISGTYNGCTGGDRCFSFNMGGNDSTFTGTIKNCKAGNTSFITSIYGTATISSGALISNCIGGDMSFGYNGETDSSVTIDGIIEYCQGSNYCFGSTPNRINITISGTIKNCQGGNYCFGCNDDAATVTISGTIENCKSLNTSFGFNSSTNGTVLISGTLNNCKGLNNCFKNTEYNISGELIRCSNKISILSDQNPIIWYGLIDRCELNMYNDSTSVLYVGDGTKIKKSDIINYGSSSYTISSFDDASSVNIISIHNSFNKAWNPLVSNIITYPYDVIDSGLI